MKKYVLLFLAFAGALTIYTYTLCPSVDTGDSGEFITAAYTLGITHPPSSPVWCLLTKLFTYLPFSSVGWRVNFSSAVYSACASAGICLLVYLITQNAIAALVSALLYAGLNTTWAYSVVAKNYTLAALFTTLFFGLIYRWDTSGKRSYLYWACFTLSAGICVHYIMLPLVPVLIIFAVYKRIAHKIKFSGAAAAACFLVGLLFFVYLPLRAKANPPINCGNPQNLTNFIYTVNRTQFAHQETGFSFMGIYLPIQRQGLLSPVRLIQAAAAQNYILTREFGWLFFLMGIAGACVLFRRRRSIFYVTALCFFASLYLFLWSTSTPIRSLGGTYVTHIPALIVFCLWIGCAAAWCFDKAKKYPFLRYGILLPVIFGSVFHVYARNFPLCSKKGCFIAHDFGRAVLGGLDKNAVIFTHGADITGILAYEQICEKQRPDIVIIDRLNNYLVHYYSFLPQMTPDDVDKARLNTELPIIQSSGRPVYYVFDSEIDGIEMPGVTLRQEGLLYRVVPDGQSFQVKDVWDTYLIRGIANRDFLRDMRVAKLVSEYYWHRARFAKTEGNRDAALQYFRKSSEVNMYRHPEVSGALALEYMKLQRYDDAAEELNKSIALNKEIIRLYALLGQVYLDTNQLGKAIDAFTGITKIKAIPAVYDTLAQLSFQNGDYDKAKAAALASLGLEARNDLPHLVLGLICMRQGSEARAREELQQALSFNPSNSMARQALEKLK